jgi:anti-sigma B factor antagonist
VKVPQSLTQHCGLSYETLSLLDELFASQSANHSFISQQKQKSGQQRFGDTFRLSDLTRRSKTNGEPLRERVRRNFVLKVWAEKLGTVTILHFEGRIVNGIATSALREAVFDHLHSNTVILNLAHVDLIDAAGLGALLELRAWTQSKGIAFKLTNVTRLVHHVFEITCLDSVFEITPQEIAIVVGAT